MKIILTILITPFTITWNGYLFSILWGWFIVPVFALPALSVPYSIGLALVVRFITSQISCADLSDDDSWSDWTKRFIMRIGKPIFALGIGFIVKQFI